MKIWTYGCSFTAGVRELFLSDQAWPNLLDVGVEHQTMNRGHAGGGFYDVREHVLEDIGIISQEDLVIIQLPFSNRVVIPYFVEEWDSYMRILHREVKLEDNNGWFKYLKDVDGLDRTLEKEAAVLFRALDQLNVNYLWWTSSKLSPGWYDAHSEKELLIDNHTSSYVDWIKHFPNYWYSPKFEDWHQNVKGHIAMAKAFSLQIQRRIRTEEGPKRKLF